ncbi:MAG: phosphoribosyl-AMP cyclohydrolase [Caldilineales bacterium]|nr:phosphoribosyl-AMP cyclohydrolase [Caldilineales bacterium]
MPDRPRYVAGSPAETEPIPAASVYASEVVAALESDIRFDERGLIPAIVQDAETNAVLMLAYMNRQALELTIQTGETHFWSRSRAELWHKGATSGNYQHVVDMQLDCDGDTLLVRVHADGPACHTGEYTCFYRSFSVDADSGESAVDPNESEG